MPLRIQRNTTIAINEIKNKWGDKIIIPDGYEFKNVD